MSLPAEMAPPKSPTPAQQVSVLLVANFLYVWLVHGWMLWLPAGNDLAQLNSLESLYYRTICGGVLHLPQYFGLWPLPYRAANVLLLYGCMAGILVLTRLVVKGPWWLGSVAAVLVMASPLKTEALTQVSGATMLEPALAVIWACVLAAWPTSGLKSFFLQGLAAGLVGYAISRNEHYVAAPLLLICLRQCSMRFQYWPTFFWGVAALMVFVGKDFSLYPLRAVHEVFLTVYPLGLLPGTAGWIASGTGAWLGVVAVIAGWLFLWWVTGRREVAWCGAAALLLRAAGPVPNFFYLNGKLMSAPWREAPLNLVTLEGGGHMILPLACVAMGFAAICHQVMKHPAWPRHVVFLTTLLCVLFMGLQIRAFRMMAESHAPQKAVSRLAPLLLVLFALFARGAQGQEALTTLLDRGYVAHWLVCGPFPPDAEGGLLKAVAEGRAPLGASDFMLPRGGATKIRPQHLDIIETDHGDAVWQKAGANDYTLDLSPFYPSAREGVTYAGFYTRSDATVTTYIDLQTPLGARVWLNGYLLRDVRVVPLAASGRDQFLAAFRPGENFLMIETPGAAFEELAKALGMTERDLSARGLLSRPLLQGRSGFEIALRIRPAQPLGEGENAVAVVPRLASEGTYSGQASAPRQDFTLTVFNNGPAATPSLSATLRYSPVELPLYASIGSVGGKAAKDTRVSVPLAKIPEDRGLPVEITVTDGTLSTTFNQTLARDKAIEPGKVFVLTGPHLLAAPTVWPPEPAWLDGFGRQLLQAGNDAAYGIDVGPEVVWEAALLGRPEAFADLRKLVGSGQCATEAAYAPAEPLWLSPTLLARNLSLGYFAGKDVLSDAAPALITWEQGALAQQLPQLARGLDLPGVVTDVPARGLAELSQWIGPDGTALWVRRKESARGPLGLAELRQMASLQRRELLARELSTDILVDEAATAPPEPFLAGEVEELGRAVPSILFRGGGAQSFFEDLKASGDKVLETLPRGAWPLDEAAPARVRNADALWLAHWRAQGLLDSAQRFATIAQLYGMDYPGEALARAERALLYLAAYAAPDADEDAFADAMSETRQAAALASDALKASTAFLAAQAETLKGAPVDTQGVRALVVFNPSSWVRTDLVSTEILVPAQSGVRVVDDEGAEVPVRFDTARVLDARSRTQWITFTASDVPGIGHRTYYLMPSVAAPKTETRPDRLIENEFFEVTVDAATGDVEQVTLKETGEALLSGPGNAFALAPENAGGRKLADGLWTEGAVQRATGKPELTTTVSPACQTITARQDFLGGKLVRSVMLFAGLRRVEYESRLEGGETPGLLATTFSIGGPQHVTASGTAFGASVRANADTGLEFRTTQGAGLYPALYWTARSPGEQVQVGTEGGIPLLPAVIVHGAAPHLRDAAQALAGALAKRGIPVKVLPSEIAKPDFLWSDSTEMESHAEAWTHGMRMRFVLGSPEQNSVCSEVVKGQTPETIKWLSDRAADGVIAYVSDAAEAGRAAVPTFMFIGPTATRSAELVGPVVRELGVRGTFTLPASSFVPSEIPKTPERGAALVFEGSANVSTSAGGATSLVLAQGAALSGEQPRHAPVWRYALLPLDGAWTSGEAARAGHAFNAPFCAATTELHAGRVPARTAYARLDAPGAIVTDLRPAGGDAGAGGLLVQACVPSPEKTTGLLDLGLRVRQAAVATSGGFAGDAVPLGEKGATVALPGFGIGTWWVLPGSPPARVELPTPPVTTKSKAPAVLSPYWRHHTAPPYGTSPEVAVRLEGTLDENAASVRLHVGSLAAKGDLEGIVLLSASDGLALSPTQLYVHLAPGEAQERDIALLWNGAPQPGSGIVATLVLGERQFRDVLEHEPQPLKVEAQRSGAKITVKVTNPNALAAEGFADCVAPTDYWPELAMGDGPRLTPRRQALSVPAFESAEVVFTLSDGEAAPPLRVKVAANGHVLYANVATPAPPPAKPEGKTGAPSPTPPPPRASAPAVEPEKTP